MAVVGPLGDSWRSISLLGENLLELKVISDQDRQVIGTLVASVEEIVRVPMDAEGNVMV